MNGLRSIEYPGGTYGRPECLGHVRIRAAGQGSRGRPVGSWKIDEGTGVGLRRVYRFLPDGQMDNLVVSPEGELVRQSTSIWWVENGELCLSQKLNYPVDAGVVVVLDKMLGHSAAKKHDVIVRLPLSEVSRDRVLVLKPAIPGEAALLKLKWTRFPEQ